MARILFLATLAAAVVVGVGYANQSTAKKTVVIPVTKAPANNGKQMYVNYCALGAEEAAHQPGRLEPEPRREVPLEAYCFGT